MPQEAISATAEGINEMVDRIPLLRRIHVRYRLSIPTGTRDKVDRALASHVDKCPTARSLVGAVEVTWEADITER
jgi:organic hydroperoxide reductase OsmC/OhrA